MKLDHIAIICRGKRKALTFWQDGLGFSLKKACVRPERQDEIIWLQGYGLTLELFIKDAPDRQDNPEAAGLRHLAFSVSDLDEIAQRLRELGFIPEPYRQDSFDGTLLTFVKDGDGCVVELRQGSDNE